jgi:hypothetical protein
MVRESAGSGFESLAAHKLGLDLRKHPGLEITSLSQADGVAKCARDVEAALTWANLPPPSSTALLQRLIRRRRGVTPKAQQGTAYGGYPLSAVTAYALRRPSDTSGCVQMRNRQLDGSHRLLPTPPATQIGMVPIAEPGRPGFFNP